MIITIKAFGKVCGFDFIFSKSFRRLHSSSLMKDFEIRNLL
jgi:hypothetical protein